MKKIINTIEYIVDDMCQGIAAANPDVALDERYRIISRKNLDANKVSLISGGGSGHEPAHAGFVGNGMLTAAVCGDVFASPSTIQVYNAILQTKSDKGTLLIIKNYSGDVMNFEAAAEMAVEDGIDVECVYVNDDIAVEDSLYTIGRRGVAGTLFVHKIAGAAAEAGKELPEVKRIAEKVIQNIKSIGFALTSCTVPAKGTPTFSLPNDEIEYGVGIHGEPGIQRCKMDQSDLLAQRMCGSLVNELNLVAGDTCALMINGLGTTPLMELFVLTNDVVKYMEKLQIKIHKVMVGNYMTSLDMAGASVTALKLDSELTPLLDAETSVSMWK